MGMSFGSFQVKRGVDFMCKNCLGCFLWKIKHIHRIFVGKSHLFLAWTVAEGSAGHRGVSAAPADINIFRKTCLFRMLLHFPVP